MSKESRSVGTIAYHAILHDVIHGTLKAGQKLKLTELKNGYNVSISTIREVLNRLTNDGFIVAEEQKGFCVAPLTKKHLDELIYLRYLLEADMMKLSLKEGDLNWESQVIAAHYRLHKYEEKFMNNRDYNSYDLCIADFEFHKAIVSASNSTELMSLHEIIYTKYLRYQINALGFRGVVAAEEHKALLQYCLERNVSGASKVLKEHIYKASQLFTE